MNFITGRTKDQLLFDNYWCKPTQIDSVSDFSILVFFKAYNWHIGQYDFKNREWHVLGGEEKFEDMLVEYWMIPPDSPDWMEVLEHKIGEEKMRAISMEKYEAMRKAAHK